MKARRDQTGVALQGFAPSRIVAVGALGTFTPESTDSAFRVPATTTYQINGAGELGTIIGGCVTCIGEGVTSYKITTAMNIEVG